MQPEDQRFVQETVKYLVRFPDDVRVERTTDERGVLLTIYCNPLDMGALIGQSGMTIGAVRRLVSMVGWKNGSRVGVKIFDPAPRPPKSAEFDLRKFGIN